MRAALPAAAFDRISMAAATSLAYFAGYLTVHEEWAAVLPKQPWQWLPYLGIAVAALAAMPEGRRPFNLLRWLCIAVAVIVSGYFLTPTWPIFRIAWPVTICLTTGYFLLLTALIDVLPAQHFGRTMLIALPLAAAVAAAAIAADVSIRYGMLAGLATAGFAGASLARLYCGSLTESAIRGTIPVFAVLVGGISLIAALEPEKPAIELLLPPLLPAVIWIGVAAFRRGGRLSP